jgi:intracellular sulfur oxidation DsrE/DsrF family protein
MSEKRFLSPFARRGFLGLLGATVAGIPAASAQSSGGAAFTPARHEQDDWYDQLPGKHRFIFDTISPEGLSQGLAFASNYFEGNKNGYGLQDSDLAVVIVLRHKSTAFAYNDAIWKKYSADLSKTTAFVDPATKEAPVVNFYATAGATGGRPGRLNTLIKRGVHLAVCQMATRAIAGTLARSTGGTQEEIFAELAANLVPNAHLAPAGIVAVNRAQEHGYTFVSAG